MDKKNEIEKKKPRKNIYVTKKMSKIQRMPQSHAAALPRHEKDEETDKTKEGQIKQMYEKH